MFKAKSVAALLLTGATMFALPTLGRASAASPCGSTEGSVCYDFHYGYIGGCFDSPLCGCVCNDAPWYVTNCVPGGYGYCEPTGTPER